MASLVLIEKISQKERIFTFVCIYHVIINASLFFVVQIFLALSPFNAIASSEGQCPNYWSNAEKRAWGFIIEGKPVDFNNIFGELNPLESSNEEWNNDQRKISGKFIKEILSNIIFLQKIPNQEIRFVGVYVDGDILLSDITVRKTVFFLSCNVDANITLVRSTCIGSILFKNTKIKNFMALFANIHSFVAMGSNFEEISIYSSKVGFLFSLEECTISSMNFQHSSFEDNISLNNVVIEGNLEGDCARIKGYLSITKSKCNSLSLSEVEIFNGLSIGFSVINHVLSLDDAKLYSSLSVYNSEMKYFDAERAHVDGHLDMYSCTIKDSVSFNFATVESSFFMYNNEMFNFKAEGIKAQKNILIKKISISNEFDVSSSFVGANFQIQQSNINSMNAENMDIRNTMIISDYSSFLMPININGSEIGCNFEVRNSSVQAVFGENMNIGKSVKFIDNSKFYNQVCISGSYVGASIDISNSDYFGEVDLGGTHIRGGLFLGDSLTNKARWHAYSSLSLLNTKADSWQDAYEDMQSYNKMQRNNAIFKEIDSWPPRTMLTGFEYSTIGSVKGDTALHTRPVSWFIKWLSRDELAGPQPYKYLASVFKKYAERGKGDEIVKAYYLRERSGYYQKKKFINWMWSWILCLIINYGVGDYVINVFFWIILFSSLGSVVLRSNKFARRNGYLWIFFASLDRLLPIVSLDFEFKNFFEDYHGNLSKWQVYYFSLHSIIGFVLSLFLVAALTGLIQV